MPPVKPLTQATSKVFVVLKAEHRGKGAKEKKGREPFPRPLGPSVPRSLFLLFNVGAWGVKGTVKFVCKVRFK